MPHSTATPWSVLPGYSIYVRSQNSHRYLSAVVSYCTMWLASEKSRLYMEFLRMDLTNGPQISFPCICMIKKIPPGQTKARPYSMLESISRGRKPFCSSMSIFGLAFLTLVPACVPRLNMGRVGVGRDFMKFDFLQMTPIVERQLEM